MNEALRRLFDLQQVDDRLAALEVENAGLPGRIQQIQQTRAECDERTSAARQALEAAELAQRQAERALQDQEALLGKLEGQQFQVKSNDAYTALLREMDAARSAISDSETRILEAMEGIESAVEALRAAESEGRETAARLDAEEKAIGQRERELKVELEEVKKSREEVAAGLEAPQLAKYAKVAARRKPAVVLVKAEMCLGCRVGIPPQDYIEILRAEEVVTCDNCHRILVHEEKLRAS